MLSRSAGALVLAGSGAGVAASVLTGVSVVVVSVELLQAEKAKMVVRLKKPMNNFINGLWGIECRKVKKTEMKLRRL